MKLSLIVIASCFSKGLGSNDNIRLMNQLIAEVKRDLDDQMVLWSKINPTKRRSEIIPCFTYNGPSFNTHECYKMRTNADAAKRTINQHARKRKYLKS